MRGERGRNWGKPDKKDIKKEETKQKTMNYGQFETKSNTRYRTKFYLSCHLSTFQKSLPFHNGNGTLDMYRYRSVPDKGNSKKVRHWYLFVPTHFRIKFWLAQATLQDIKEDL